MNFILCILTIVFFSACASHKTPETDPGKNAPTESVDRASLKTEQKNSFFTKDTSKKIEAAATIPLADLNLIETRIPASLGAALKNPYAEPADISCENLEKDISALDEALGADLDVPSTRQNEGLITRTLVSESVSAIRKNTEAVVPFRNWVRKLSGAERKSKTVAAAISAGGIRRAYLKGIGHANKCQPPAAPLNLTHVITRE